MKKLLIAAALILVPVSAQARDQGYIEGAIGAAFIPTVNTHTYTATIGTDVVSGHGFLNYKTQWSPGAEIGYAGMYDGAMRFGISWDYLNGKLDTAGVTGTVNGVPGSITFPASTVKAAGFDFDTNVNVVAANAYYDLPTFGERITPYIGLGVGSAWIKHADTNFAGSATAGFQIAVSDDVYVGARYRFYWIPGVTDDLNIKYNAIKAHVVSAVIGVYLN